MIVDRPEQRRTARHRRRRRVFLEPGGVSALIGDISLAGAFVLTSQLRPPGSRVRLTFASPERQVLADGLVRWVRRTPNFEEAGAPIGMGIEFVGGIRPLRAVL